MKFEKSIIILLKQIRTSLDVCLDSNDIHKNIKDIISLLNKYILDLEQINNKYDKKRK